MSVTNLRTRQTCRPTLDQLAALWAMRILLNLGGHQQVAGLAFGEDSILKTVGLTHLSESSVPRRQWLKAFKARQRQLESAVSGLPAALDHNLLQLKQTVGLSDTESRLLSFASVLHQHRGLDDTADTLGSLSNDQVADVLAVILDLPVPAIKTVLSHTSLLARAGLLKIDGASAICLSGKLDLLDGLGARLFERHDHVHDLLTNYFSKTKGAELDRKDFPHIEADYLLLTRFLRGALKKRLAGVNVLLYGPPGTGKSQLARVIARHLKLSLFEINMTKADGNPLDSADRFCAYQLGQQTLARQRNTILLFDEIEDVFPAAHNLFDGMTGSSKQHGKAWVNRLLEENPLPAIWISNSIDQIDRAFLRRFDYMLKLDHPPGKVREKILRKHLKQLPVSKQWISQVADNPRLSPAMIARTGRVATLARHHRGNSERDMERLLFNTLSAMGVPTRPLLPTACETPYRLDVLNTTTDIRKLVTGIERHPHGRFCLYGPPGTGKTGFGHFLSRALDKPLRVTRASDLLDPYLGMTEKNIAGMFESATADDAVLLLDEADGFLHDRSRANKNWEISQVNELLTQMEGFDGLFICTTNRIDCLDPASLRRFDVKIGFDYLVPSQAWTLLCEALKNRGVPLPVDHVFQQRLAGCTRLTPGDFSTVLRQQRLSGDQLTAGGLLDGLIDESAFKQRKTSRGIGFMASLDV